MGRPAPRTLTQTSSPHSLEASDCPGPFQAQAAHTSCSPSVTGRVHCRRGGSTGWDVRATPPSVLPTPERPLALETAKDHEVPRIGQQQGKCINPGQSNDGGDRTAIPTKHRRILDTARAHAAEHQACNCTSAQRDWGSSQMSLKSSVGRGRRGGGAFEGLPRASNMLHCVLGGVTQVYLLCQFIKPCT